MVAQLYQPPGTPRPDRRFRYARSAGPLLSWTRATDQWPPIRYSVSVDGRPAAEVTDATHVRVALADGSHTWTVTATNRSGLESGTSSARIFVDTIAPALTLALPRRVRVGAIARLSATATDPPPASGIATVKIRWGDGTGGSIHHRASHLYLAPGRYVVTVTATDRAGNKTTVRRTIHVRPKPKPKTKRTHK
jgi:hypothetical protein